MKYNRIREEVLGISLEFKCRLRPYIYIYAAGCLGADSAWTSKQCRKNFFRDKSQNKISRSKLLYTMHNSTWI